MLAGLAVHVAAHVTPSPASAVDFAAIHRVWAAFQSECESDPALKPLRARTPCAFEEPAPRGLFRYRGPLRPEERGAFETYARALDRAYALTAGLVSGNRFGESAASVAEFAALLDWVNRERVAAQADLRAGRIHWAQYNARRREYVFEHREQLSRWWNRHHGGVDTKLVRGCDGRCGERLPSPARGHHRSGRPSVGGRYAA